MNLSRRTIIGSILAASVARPGFAQAPPNTRPASQFALDKCKEICSAMGLAMRFSVFAGDVEAAEARLAGNQRQIIYNEDWLRNLEISSDEQAVPVLVILAHEIGHHLNGHTLDQIPSDVIAPGGPRFRLREELEADTFAGNIVARLNEPYQLGLPAFASASETATRDHPSREERTNYFIGGWNSAPVPGNRNDPNDQSLNMLINLWSHTEGMGRVQTQFQGQAGRWLELQNGTPFTTFREKFRDQCGRIFLYDDSRGLWVRLTPSLTGGFGEGAFGNPQEISDDILPDEWITLDPYAESRLSNETCEADW